MGGSCRNREWGSPLDVFAQLTGGCAVVAADSVWSAPLMPVISLGFEIGGK